RMNGLLKGQFCKLGEGSLQKWRDHLSTIKPYVATNTIVYWEIKQGALAPYRATPESAGLDLHALQDCRVNVHDVQFIETGIGVQIPPEHFGLIAPHSGLALKGIQVLGGVIDAYYQGEIKVILKNNGSSDLIVHAGDRIAQLLIISIYGGKV
uniref:Deoxyuridine 5'-triphosphate nucleotidohydrolase n=1 Tax=Leptobrachium leishanense TaxID=445787 RepID=A0A8C5PWX5_9ANUR